MKIGILSTLILILSFEGFSQIAKKQSAIVELKNKNNSVITRNDTTLKMPDRNSLKMLSKEHYEFKGKNKIINDDKIHWYALENENDSVYWKNVNCSKLIIEFKRNVNIESVLVNDFLNKNNLNKVISKSLYPELQNFYVFEINNGSKQILLDIIKKAKLLPEILYAEPEALIKSLACTPNDTYWSSQWGPYVMYADTVWCFVNRPSKNWTAVIDNAIAWNHPDLYNMAWYGYDYAMNDADPTPDYTGQNHGTHVSGIIGAERNNSVGIAGMSKDTIYFAKVQNNDPTNPNLDNTAITNALNALSTNTKIKVVNMSLGASAPDQNMQTAINTFINSNKLVIASAGNDNSSNPSYPAAWSNVISVASVGVNASGNLIPASYSNYGSTIDVSAPGGESATGYYIISTLPNNTYGGPVWEGTSMAAPHVTGLAAIVWAANPFLSNTQVRTILEQQVYDLGTPGWDQFFGSGMCNAWQAFYTSCMQLSINVTASGSTTFCNGNSLTLTAPNNENVVYQWKKDGININGATSNTLIATTSGSYSLNIQTVGCQTNSNVTVVTVNDIPPAAATITGSSTVCTNQNSILYSVPQIPTATSYTWTLPNGVSGSSSTNSISANFGSSATSGNITVRGVNSCGSGNISTLPITVNITPSTPNITSSGGNILCAGNSLTLTSSSSSGNQWYQNNTVISGANGINYTTTNGGLFNVITSSNGCSSSPSNSLNITLTSVPPTPTISANGPLATCQGSGLVLTSNSTSNNQWYLNSTPISNANSNTYTPLNSGIYTVTASQNTCNSLASNPVNVTINPSPSTPLISWNGSQFSTTATGVTYQWYLNGNAITGATSATYTPTSIGVYKVTVTVNGCSSSSDNYTLVVTGIDPTLILSPYTAQVYPNPAKNDFVIKFGETPDVTLDIQLVNNLGVVLKSQKTKSNLTTVKINDLPAGIYFIKIIGGSYNQVKKIEVIK